MIYDVMGIFHEIGHFLVLFVSFSCNPFFEFILISVLCGCVFWLPCLATESMREKRNMWFGRKPIYDCQLKWLYYSTFLIFFFLFRISQKPNIWTVRWFLLLVIIISITKQISVFYCNWDRWWNKFIVWVLPDLCFIRPIWSDVMFLFLINQYPPRT